MENRSKKRRIKIIDGRENLLYLRGIYLHLMEKVPSPSGERERVRGKTKDLTVAIGFIRHGFRDCRGGISFDLAQDGELVEPYDAR